MERPLPRRQFRCSGAFVPFLLLSLTAACVPVPDRSPTAGEIGSSRWRWEESAPLPRPLSNNAVAAIAEDDGTFLYSFMGIDESKSSAGITGAAYRYDPGRAAWAEIRPVPGAARLGATAQAVEGKIYLFGGFTVDSRLRETTVPTVDIYDPRRNSYSTGAPLPVAVDDAVSGVWRNRLIFLVGGWSGAGNTKNVQVYDPRRDRWSQATPIPGPPVFGHAGGIVGDSIVYCDGVKIDLAGEDRFVLSRLCFRGEIDPSDPMRINWSSIPPHPGGAKYRMAAGVLSLAGKIAFVGGSGNPYNYNAVGYDGIPSAPSSAAFLYNPGQSRWEKAGHNILPTMDHRGLVGTGDTLTLIGGMTARGQVTPRVETFTLPQRP